MGGPPGDPGSPTDPPPVASRRGVREEPAAGLHPIDEVREGAEDAEEADDDEAMADADPPRGRASSWKVRATSERPIDQHDHALDQDGDGVVDERLDPACDCVSWLVAAHREQIGPWQSPAGATSAGISSPRISQPSIVGSGRPRGRLGPRPAAIPVALGEGRSDRRAEVERWAPSRPGASSGRELSREGGAPIIRPFDSGSASPVGAHRAGTGRPLAPALWPSLPRRPTSSPGDRRSRRNTSRRSPCTWRSLVPLPLAEGRRASPMAFVAGGSCWARSSSKAAIAALAASANSNSSRKARKPSTQESSLLAWIDARNFFGLRARPGRRSPWPACRAGLRPGVELEALRACGARRRRRGGRTPCSRASAKSRRTLGSSEAMASSQRIAGPTGSRPNMWPALSSAKKRTAGQPASRNRPAAYVAHAEGDHRVVLAVDDRQRDGPLRGLQRLVVVGRGSHWKIIPPETGNAPAIRLGASSSGGCR